MRTLRITFGIALSLLGGFLMIKAGWPSGTTMNSYTAPPADISLEFGGLAFAFLGAMFIVGREHPEDPYRRR